MTTELDTSRKYAPSNLGSVLILGLGKSGRAAALYCAGLMGTRVRSLCIYGGASTDENRAFAEALPSDTKVVFDSEQVEGSFDLCIASPGISQFGSFYRAAQAVCDEVISEVEFAWRESAAASRWVAITGTNGKTTTTALAAHLLRAAGFKADAVGNIGDTCLDAVAEGATDVYVAEVSSYQLASTARFAPDVAVILNITPDHLKWHGSLEAYGEAKRKVYANLAATEGAVAILDAVDDSLRCSIREMKADPDRGFDYIPLGTAEGLDHSMIEACGAAAAAFIDDEKHLCVEFRGVTHRFCRADELLIAGQHNVANALAAASAAVAIGADDASITQGLTSFAPLEHRIEPCGTVAGVRCYNDSKGTNVDATLKALAAFGDEKPIVLLGGDDKGTALDELVAAAERHAEAVVCFGAAGERFQQAFAPSSVVTLTAQHMEDALDTALEHAHEGDIVILSPACASFDEFTCYEERGDVFKQLVEDRRRARGA